MILFLTLLTILNLNGNQQLNVKDAWMRPAAKGMNSALYFTIENNSIKPDTLYKVKSNLAELVQLHKSFMKKGLMGMKRVKYVVVPAKSKISFKPGSYHVMFIKLLKDLKTKSEQTVELLFKSGKKLKVTAKVQLQK